jgi:hypothetical protein
VQVSRAKSSISDSRFAASRMTTGISLIQTLFHPSLQTMILTHLRCRATPRRNKTVFGGRRTP